MITLTAAETTALLKEIVAEKGEDYIYRADARRAPGYPVDCWYLKGDEPSCLVGHLFVRAGVPLDRIRECEEEDASNTVPQLLDVPAGFSSALQVMQQAQDRGETWGKALKAYDQELSEFYHGEDPYDERDGE